MRSEVKRSSRRAEAAGSQSPTVIVIENTFKGREAMAPRPAAALRKARGRLALLSRLPKRGMWIIAAVVVLAAAGGLIYAIRRASAESSAQPSTLQTATARQGSLVLMVSGTGTMLAAQDSALGFEAAGELVELHAGLGEQVEAGQLLAQIDDADALAQLADARQTLLELTSPASIAIARQNAAQAELDLYNAQVARSSLTYWYDDAAYQNALAGYTLAQDRLARAQEMYNRASGDVARAQAYQNLYAAQKSLDNARYYVNVYSSKPSQRQIDEADADLALAEARLDEARNYLAALTGEDVPDDATGDALVKLRQAESAVREAEAALESTRLVAPFSGTVMEIDAEVGDTVSGPVIRLANLEALVVEFYMDGEDWSGVQAGYEAEVTFDALPDQVFTGVVTEVSPGLVSVQNTSMVFGSLRLDQSYSEIQLPAGVGAAVDVISGRAENAILIPIEALHEISDEEYAVFVVVDGRPRVRTVEVGLQDSYYAAITSGLQAGEVVTTGIVETGQ